ncbi:MAG TPA: VUT family protein [Caulobacterales bacterium]|nr:VUT family protein [Caulobacterales bacterium]
MSAMDVFLTLQQPQFAMPIVAATVIAIVLMRKPWTAAYVGLMPLINWSFSAVPTFPIPHWLGGGAFQPLAIVTGFVLVVRDFAQNEVKHWIFAAMAAGLVLSSLTSWIQVVVASGAAFLISESVDWAVYTFVKRPLSERVLLSSVFSAPLDQIVFIFLASFVVPGIFAFGTVMTGILSKLFGAYVVSQVMAAHERRTEMKPA